MPGNSGTTLEPCSCAARYWDGWVFLLNNIKAAKVADIDACVALCQGFNGCNAFSFFIKGYFHFLMPMEVMAGNNCLLKSEVGGGIMDSIMASGATSGFMSSYKPPMVPSGTPTEWNPKVSPTAAPTVTVTTKPAGPTSPAVNPNRPNCDDTRKFCYWQDIGLGFSVGFLHQCAASSQEKCWNLCQSFTGCKAASYDTKNRWATNCFLYTHVGAGQVIAYPGMVSGWFCSYTPPEFPNKPSSGCWVKPPPFPKPTPPGTTTSTTTTITTTTTTTTPKPKPPNCSGGSLGFCRIYGDPHFQTTDGKKFDNHAVGQYVMAAYNGAQRPKFTVRVNLSRRWPCNHRISMVDRFWIRFDSEDGCGRWEIEGWLTNPRECSHDGSARRRNRVTTRITFIDFKAGRRGATTTAQWSQGRSKMSRSSTQVSLTTWFGLRFSYGTYDWDAQLRIPGCYKHILVSGVCSKWDGNRWNDHGHPVGRRSVIDFDQDQVNHSAPIHAVARRSVAQPVCPAQKVHIEQRCGLLNSNVFSQCHAKFPTDGANGDEENCIFDLCSAIGEDASAPNPDACIVLEGYAKMCMTNMAGQLTKSDKICNWAADTGCVPQCPANSSFQPCADSCKDVRTCGERSPVPRDCPEVELESLCICNDGYALLNEKCVPEAECGCVTDEQAVVEDGFFTQTCRERCHCKNGAYTCESHAENVKIDGCSDDKNQEFPIFGPVGDIDEVAVVPVDPQDPAPADPELQLIALRDGYKTKVDTAFGAHRFGVVASSKISKTVAKMTLTYTKFNCAGARRRRRAAPKKKSAAANDCSEMKQYLEDMRTWNVDHLYKCGTGKDAPRVDRRVENFNRHLVFQIKRQEKKCESTIGKINA